MFLHEFLARERGRFSALQKMWVMVWALVAAALLEVRALSLSFFNHKEAFLRVQAYFILEIVHFRGAAECVL